MGQLPVVLGYDGRRRTRDAVLWAAGEASRQGVTLVVLHAANYPGMVGPPGPGLLDQEPGALEAAREVTARGVAEATSVVSGLSVAGQTEVTSPKAALIDASSTASLLVIGSHAWDSAMAGLLGSVAMAVAGNAHCPLVVVKDGTGAMVAGGGRPVVVGTDGSPAAEPALLFAAHYAEANTAALEIVCCAGDQTSSAAAADAALAAGREVVRDARARVEQLYPRLQLSSRVVDGPAVRGLAHASTGAGLLVVGSRGRGAFRVLVAGSTACGVIHAADCPVAVVGSAHG